MSPARLVRLCRVSLLVTLIASAGSCASSGQVPGGPVASYLPKAKLNKARIEVWVDRANRCRTSTTPYFQVKKSEKAKWEIQQTAECPYDVEIRFDKGDADPTDVACARKGPDKIECDIRGDANEQRYEYSVIINGAVEDPEIEIVM